jgi:hypothetical protein
MQPIREQGASQFLLNKKNQQVMVSNDSLSHSNHLEDEVTMHMQCLEHAKEQVVDDSTASTTLGTSDFSASVGAFHDTEDMDFPFDEQEASVTFKQLQLLSRSSDLDEASVPLDISSIKEMKNEDYRNLFESIFHKPHDFVPEENVPRQSLVAKQVGDLSIFPRRMNVRGRRKKRGRKQKRRKSFDFDAYLKNTKDKDDGN